MSNEYQRPPIKVAIMGIGRAILNEHYPIFRQHPALFDVVAACDITKERRDIIAKDYPNCRMFRQFKDMLDERDIDLVDIATPSINHVKHAMMSLKHGFWTLLETPMALTQEDAQMLRAQAIKSKNRLIVFQRGLLDPDFMLARRAVLDKRLGTIQRINIRREDYVRRDDWQCVKRLGGGATYYAATDMVIQALMLLAPQAPFQMWSELRRIAALGDAEDCVRLFIKTRAAVSADILFNGGSLPVPELRSPSFEVIGDRGVFRVQPGASEGKLWAIDPNFTFPRRRSSVRTPRCEDLHEQFPIIEDTISLPRGSMYGQTAFWKHVYNTVRVASPFPFTLDQTMEAVRIAHLVKKSSQFC